MSLEQLNTKLDALIKDIIALRKENSELKSALNETNKDVKLLIDVNATIHQIVEDQSKKADILCNIVEPVPKTKPSTSKKDSSEESKTDNTKKPKKQIIQEFFKKNYMQDEHVFDDILDENQAASVFKEKQADILKKKEGPERNKYKAELLYKNLTPGQKKQISAKRDQDYDKSITNNTNDIEEDDSE
jgi:hypothetical protein